MIEVVDSDAVVATSLASLGVDIDELGVLSSDYIAAAVRRLAGFACPCSPRTLVRGMVESHRGLVADVEMFAELVDGVIETLLAIGDLLELADVALEGEQVRGTWIVAAPPTFVVRPSGSGYILGLSADEQTPLPMEMRSRVVSSRGIRVIEPIIGEDLATALRDLGVRELSPDTWLKCPKAVAPTTLIASYDSKLSGLQASGEVPDLLVLDGSRKTRSYRARWVPPGELTGNFVIRRPQTFGADLWGYAQLNAGSPVRLLDLPLHGDRWRGCDVAWRIQMAIDALAQRPQQYRLRSDGQGTIFDFFSPIPKWARRRLGVIGREIDPAGCLISFLVAEAEVATEEKFLRELLFLARTSE